MLVRSHASFSHRAGTASAILARPRVIRLPWYTLVELVDEKRKTGPTVNLCIPKDLEARIDASASLIGEVMGESFDRYEAATFILEKGLDTILSDVVFGVEQSSSVEIVRELGRRHPKEVFALLVEDLTAGRTAVDRETFKPAGYL